MSYIGIPLDNDFMFTILVLTIIIISNIGGEMEAKWFSWGETTNVMQGLHMYDFSIIPGYLSWEYAHILNLAPATCFYLSIFLKLSQYSCITSFIWFIYINNQTL